MPWVVVLPVALIAAYTDTRWGKIKNWLTVPAFLAGLVFAGITGGWYGVGQALLAAIVIVPLSLLMTVGFNMGDVKLLMAIGAWLGLGLLFPFFFAMCLSRLIFALCIRLAKSKWNLIQLKEKVAEEAVCRTSDQYGSVGGQVILVALTILFSILYIPIPPFEWVSANVIR